jgi:transketolase
MATTVKGKGVSFMENQAGWHGIPTKDRKQLDQALADIAAPEITEELVDSLIEKSARIEQANEAGTLADMPRFSRDYWWNAQEDMQVDMDPTRMGFGRALKAIGGDERLIMLHADISASIRITDFSADHPERKSRVHSVGIAEQNMVSVAAGLARNGRIPVGGTYGVFASGRNWDQWRTTVCYSNLNVKMAGAHGGLSVGADGATHQALEEIAILNVLPNMHLAVPADAIETEKAAKAVLLDVVGPGYVRYGREATPVVTTAGTPYQWGVANIIRFRGAKPRFIDAFETRLASQYAGEDEDIAIIACGAMVPEAMRAAYILKAEHGLETRIVNVHTVKPIDQAAISAACADIGVIVTVEEQQTGGFGNIVASVLCRTKGHNWPLKMDMIGVDDKFGQSGPPWQLTRRFGLAAESIAQRALALLERQ